MAQLQLILPSRSAADDFFSSLQLIHNEANDFLRSRHVTDEETKTMAQVCFENWDAYQWISGAIDGRVGGDAGAHEMREKFPLLSAAVAAWCSGWAIFAISGQLKVDDPKDFCDHLISMNPGKRDLPLGLNATSGITYIANLCQLAEMGIRNFRVSAKIPIDGDLRSVVRNAERGLKIVLAAAKGHAATHGSSEEKEQRRKKLQEAVHEKHQENPALSYRRVCEFVAAKNSVSTKTVTRHAPKTW